MSPLPLYTTRPSEAAYIGCPNFPEMLIPFLPDFEKLVDMPMEEARSHFERWMLRRVLDRCGGNQTKAARHLGLSRAGLFKKMKKLEV